MASVGSAAGGGGGGCRVICREISKMFQLQRAAVLAEPSTLGLGSVRSCVSAAVLTYFSEYVSDRCVQGGPHVCFFALRVLVTG